MISNPGKHIQKMIAGCALLAAILFVAAPTLAGPDCVTLVFQGQVEGRIEDCKCPKLPLGGLERRAALLGDIHENCGAVIAIDAGNMLGPIAEGMREQSAFLSAETAELGYRSVGIGPNELHFGVEFLRELEEAHGLRFTSANLRTDGEPVFAPYLIEEAAGLRVGIISVLDPESELVSEMDDLDGITVTDPFDALRGLLPRLNEEADIVVVLSNLERLKTRELGREFGVEHGIDFLIEGNSSKHYGKILPFKGARLMAANNRGKYLGEIRLGLREGKWDGSVEYTEHGVDSRDPGDKATGERVREFLDSRKMASDSK